MSDFTLDFSQFLAAQNVRFELYLVTFSTYSNSLILGNFLGVFRHKQDLYYFKAFTVYHSIFDITSTISTKLSCYLLSLSIFPRAFTCPSSTPSVLSGINKIFTVANIIIRSSSKLGWLIYIRSISSLS